MNFDLMSDFFQEPLVPIQNDYEQGINPKELPNYQKNV